MTRISITFPGAASSIRTFGGSPYFLTSALRDAGYTARGLDLRPPSDFVSTRYLWNASEIIVGHGRGGFQYSADYLDRAWAELAEPYSDEIVVNMFQLFGPSWLRRRPEHSFFYIDQTLRQLFANYPDMRHASKFQKQRAIVEEARQYAVARGVICKCQWAAKSVISEYGIDATKVFVVPSGANLDAACYRNWEANHDSRRLHRSLQEELRLVFVGKDAKRKGLHRLLAALEMLSERSSTKVTLTVIGADPSDITSRHRSLPNVKWIARIDKASSMTEFIEIVGSHDIGVLLSNAEAGGLSLREFQLLGLGVIAPNVGGSPEMIIPSAGILVDAGASTTDLALLLKNLADSPEKVLKMKNAAWERRAEMSWEYAVSKLATIFARLSS